MKMNELMIGDWVNFLIDIVGGETEFDPVVNEYQPMRVDSISSLGEVDSELGVINDVSQLQPISLTAEILKKNFNFDPNNSEGTFEHYWWSNGYLDVAITEFTDGIWEVEVDEIEMGNLPTWKMFVSNVHELQHALHLCNIEKEIEL